MLNYFQKHQINTGSFTTPKLIRRTENAHETYATKWFRVYTRGNVCELSVGAFTLACSDRNSSNVSWMRAPMWFENQNIASDDVAKENLIVESRRLISRLTDRWSFALTYRPNGAGWRARIDTYITRIHIYICACTTRTVLRRYVYNFLIFEKKNSPRVQHADGG